MRTWHSTKCPILAFAITGIVTAAMISLIMPGSDMRATPPCALISAGTRSSAITATAPASSAMRAWCALYVRYYHSNPSMRIDVTYLLSVDDVHDDAALQHLRKAGLDCEVGDRVLWAILDSIRRSRLRGSMACHCKEDVFVYLSRRARGSGPGRRREQQNGHRPKRAPMRRRIGSLLIVSNCSPGQAGIGSRGVGIGLISR